MTVGYLLAVDVGTGSVRAVLFTEAAKQVGISQHEYVHRPIPGVPGSQVFDTSANWAAIGRCVRQALASAGVPASAVKAVSATSMREGMVLYDGSGREIWACPNADSRAADEARELVESGQALEIYKQAGDWVSITAPARFRWLAREEPETFARIAHVGMLGDWVLTKLSGQFVTDASLGSSSGMFDLARRDWSDSILDMCELGRDVVPRVVASGSVIGEVTKIAAAETGLAEGTPVVVGGADTQLGLLGIGAAQARRFTVLGGSFWQHTMLLDEPVIDPRCRLRTLCHVSPGLWMMEGIGFYSGLVMRWFRDQFCEPERALADAEGVDVYSIMERKAAAVPPGAHGVMALFSNIMQADHWVHTTPGFLGLDVVANPEHAGRAECFRAIEEGAAYVALAHMRIVEELAREPVKEAVLTGGAAKGELWPRIVADTLGVPVHIPAVRESTALGAAICAGAGIGLWDGLEQASVSLASYERTVHPEAAAHQRYQDLAAQWTKVYGSSMQLVESGLMAPFWRAAGT